MVAGAMYRFVFYHRCVFAHSFATLVESIFPRCMSNSARFLDPEYLSLTKVKEISGSFLFVSPDIMLRCIELKETVTRILFHAYSSYQFKSANSIHFGHLIFITIALQMQII